METVARAWGRGGEQVEHRVFRAEKPLAWDTRVDTSHCTLVRTHSSFNTGREP